MEQSSSAIKSRRLYFSLLPSDLFDLLFLRFSSAELLTLLPQVQSMKDFNKLFNSKTFWTELWKRDISTILVPSSDIYKKYEDIIETIAKHSVYSQIKYLAKDGYDRLLMHVLKNIILKNIGDYNLAMSWAALGGHTKIVRLMLDRGANDYNDAMNYAASGGHIEIVKLMLDRGASNYNKAIKYAQVNKNTDIIELLKSYM